MKKLGIKPGSAVYIEQAPKEYFDWLHPLPENISVKKRLAGELDFIHLFVKQRKTFQDSFLKAKKFLKRMP